MLPRVRALFCILRQLAGLRDFGEGELSQSRKTETCPLELWKEIAAILQNGKTEARSRQLPRGFAAESDIRIRGWRTASLSFQSQGCLGSPPRQDSTRQHPACATRAGDVPHAKQPSPSARLLPPSFQMGSRILLLQQRSGGM